MADNKLTARQQDHLEVITGQRNQAEIGLLDCQAQGYILQKENARLTEALNEALENKKPQSKKAGRAAKTNGKDLASVRPG